MSVLGASFRIGYWYLLQLSILYLRLVHIMSKIVVLHSSTFNHLKTNYNHHQVGIPIAAGVLLPVSGTMLTPSIAGALMGLSSVGVTTNSLLLRLKFMSKHRKYVGETLKLETPEKSQVLEREDKSKHPCNATS